MRTTALLLLLAFGLATPGFASPRAGATAPGFAARTLDGRVFHLADLRGKVVLLHFWATWCPPCREELPALERYYRQHKAEGLEIVALSIEGLDDLEQVRKVAAVYSFPLGLVANAEISDYGRIWMLPLSFVIDRHGRLRISEWTGERKIDDARLDAALTPLLEEH
jgi:peroxiredoxin